MEKTPSFFSTINTAILLIVYAQGRNVYRYLPKELSKQERINIIDYSDKIKLKAVPLSQFRNKVQETSSHYDFLRIFFNRPDLSEGEIDGMIDAGLIETDENKHLDRGFSIIDPNIQIHGNIYLPMQDRYKPFDFKGLNDVYDFIDELDNSPLSVCRYPQPEIHHVGREGVAGKICYPDCIILHRCRNVSGCCENENEVCSPKRIQIIRKPFFVLRFHGKDEIFVQPKKKLVEYRMFINHTECECRKIKTTPWCVEKCPRYFLKTRKGSDCECDCDGRNRRCLNIKNGFESMQSSELVCIKRGQCKIPRCRSGSFDIRTGFCPWPFSIVPLRPRLAVPRLQTKQRSNPMKTEAHLTVQMKNTIHFLNSLESSTLSTRTNTSSRTNTSIKLEEKGKKKTRRKYRD